MSPLSVLRLFLSVLALQQVSAVKVAPTNDTSSDNVANQFVMETTLDMTQLSPNINPLTGPAGLQGGISQAKVGRVLKLWLENPY